MIICNVIAALKFNAQKQPKWVPDYNLQQREINSVVIYVRIFINLKRKKVVSEFPKCLEWYKNIIWLVLAGCFSCVAVSSSSTFDYYYDGIIYFIVIVVSVWRPNRDLRFFSIIFNCFVWFIDRIQALWVSVIPVRGSTQISKWRCGATRKTWSIARKKNRLELYGEK